jgi:Tol biopolymer transport system component
MPDLKDAFRLATDHARPAPGALDRQRALQRRAAARRKASVYIAVAAVLVLLVAVVLASAVIGRRDDRTAIPVPGPSGLFSLDVGTGVRTPFHDPGHGTFDFELSPDGSQLLMSWDHMQFGKREVWIANADGTGAHELVRTDGAMGTWFPDSRHIAYVGLPRGSDTRQVIVLDTETGVTTVVTDEESDPKDPTVSPDGRTIVYTVTETAGLGRPPGDRGEPPAPVPPTSRLRAVDAEGSSKARTLATSHDTGYWMPDVAPSGDIVWVSGRYMYIGLDDLAEIRLIGAHDGDGVIVASNGDDIIWVDRPTWSPDGSLLAYTRETPDGPEVWVYDPTSGEHREVGQGAVEGWLDDDTVLIGM